MANSVVHVELGFVEEVESDQLLSVFFPSKVGGKPSWLKPTELLNAEDLKCKVCGSVFIFLLQVYTPMVEIKSCFHRTIFVFCCKNGKCFKNNSNTSFVVVRGQLPRDNDFYENDGISEDLSLEDLSLKMQVLEIKSESKCEVCGCNGSKKCSGCKMVVYCSKEHQTIDWKSEHKNLCIDLKNSAEKSIELHRKSPSALHLLFPEFELLTEPEPKEKYMTNNKKSTDKCDYKCALEKDSSDVNNEEFEQLFATGNIATLADKQFQAFKKRIAREPEQVLRYSCGGEPLWVSADHIPTKDDIPPCSCGAARQFEFQIMPQLLNHLKVDNLEDSIDWGTVAIYTCTQNCEEGPAYHKEFVWKQDFSEEDCVPVQN